MKNSRLIEMFGEPIGALAGEPAVGVRDERMSCRSCGMMPVDLEADGCGCGYEEEQLDDMCHGCSMPVDQCCCEESNVCPACGMMSLEPGGECTCVMSEAKRRKKKGGPSKKTAQKILKGTKTFAQKMQKVSGWAESPPAAAAWMMHKATGKWPSEK